MKFRGRGQNQPKIQQVEKKEAGRTNISGISRLKFSALIYMGDSDYSPYTPFTVSKNRGDHGNFFKLLTR